jgi:tight adherence protein B
MTQSLALMSLMLVLVAVAIELWWGSAAHQQRRKALEYIEQNLYTHDAHASTRILSRAVADIPASHTEQPIDALLLRAGLPKGMRMPVALVLPGLVLAMLSWWRIGIVWAVPLVLVVYAAGVWLWLRARIEKQHKQLLRQLPDFLDGLVRVMSIGNSVPMAFQTITGTTQMPLRAILDRSLLSVRAGMDLDRALQLASASYRMEELELLHVVLGTGVRMGGRADQIMQRMSDFMRDLSHARQELHAITSETRLSAWVLGLLPLVVATFMTLFNPAFFMPMFTQPLGHKVLLIALCMEAVGAFLLYRLAKSL